MSLDEARERHVPVKYLTGEDVCGSCVEADGWEHQPVKWPCDAGLFRDALDATEAILTIARNDLIREGMERDAARALADELAGVLTSVIADDMVLDYSRRDAAAALAKWEASHE